MKNLALILLSLILAPWTFAQSAQPGCTHNNAALHYWNAFAQMKDQPLAEAQSKQLEAIAEGQEPWNEALFGQLLEQNSGAVETMVRGTTLPFCDWGVDYALNAQAPIPQIGRGRALARLNLLTAARLAAQGNSREATSHLIAGLRFSRDLSSGMPLIGAALAKTTIMSDLHMALALNHAGKLTAEDRKRYRAVLRAMPSEGVDWSQPYHQEAKVLHGVMKQLQASRDPQKLIESWGMRDLAVTRPLPKAADIERMDSTMAEAERLLRPNSSPTQADLARFDQRLKELPPLLQALVPSLQTTLARRQELRALRNEALSQL
jgi:hypothetical protein